MLKWTKIKKKLSEPWAAYTFAICSGVVLFLFLSNLHILWNSFKAFYYFISPVLVGIVIAYILDPLVKFCENKLFAKLKNRSAARLIGVIITFALLILVIVILLVAMIPQLVSSVQMFVENLGIYSRSFNRMLKDLQDFAAQYNIDISRLTDSVQDIFGNITRNAPNYVNRVLNTTISYSVEFFNLIISFIIAIYILMDKTRLLNGGKRLWKALTNEKSYQISNDFLGRCNAIMMEYILFDLLDGLLIGILNAAFMLIVRYPYVPLISVIVGVTNLAPTFGPILGAIIGSVILVLVNPWYALGFLIFTIALQTMDGYVIKPKLFGGQLGVPSIWILIALIVFGRMWGVIGILLAIPFAAIIDFVYQDVILVRLERRRNKIIAAEAAAKSRMNTTESTSKAEPQSETDVPSETNTSSETKTSSGTKPQSKDTLPKDDLQ